MSPLRRRHSSKDLRLSDLVLRCSERSRQRKQPMAAWRKRESNWLLDVSESNTKGIFWKTGWGVLGQKRNCGGLRGLGVSPRKDGEDITEMGKGQGWNEFWGKDQWAVLDILDLICPLGFPLKMLDIQSVFWEWGCSSGDTDFGGY